MSAAITIALWSAFVGLILVGLSFDVRRWWENRQWERDERELTILWSLDDDGPPAERRRP